MSRGIPKRPQRKSGPHFRRRCVYRAQIANLKSDCPGIVGLLPIATAADASRLLSAFPRQRQSVVIVSRRCGQSATRCSAVRAHRRVPGKLLPRSIQLGIAVAPRLPHRVHRMCRVNDGTGTSSGQASTLTSVLLPQARQVAKSERMPRLRMLPSVIGRIGSSERGIGGHSILGRDVREPFGTSTGFQHHRPVEASDRSEP
jgi:hypothetical protein